MALLWMDGLDEYSSISDAYNFAYAGSAMTFSTSSGRFGGGGLFMGDVGTIIVPAPSALEIYIGFAIKMNDTRNGDNVICGVKSSGPSDAGIEAMVSFNAPNGLMKLWRGNQNNQLAAVTLGVPLNDNNWHWLDVHFLIDGSAGAMQVWIDGTSVVSVSGANTMRNGGITSLLGPFIGSIIVNTPHSFIDDIVVVDTTGSTNNGRIGDSQIVTLMPNSDAGPNDGTPSTGTDHFAVVDTTVWDGGTPFLTITNTTAQEELFGFPTLGSSPSSISAVQVSNFSEKTDTGSANLENIVSSSGTTAVGSSVPLATSFTRNASVFEVDPHTSAAWGAAAVNAIKAGVVVP